jgi:hypothetical protein
LPRPRINVESSRPAEAPGLHRNLVFLWPFTRQPAQAAPNLRGIAMNQIIYLIGLIVVIMAVLSLLGLR